MFDTISKKLRLVAFLIVGALGAVGGVSYGAANHDEFKHEVVIKANYRKVWDLLSDPVQTPRWMPQDILDIEKVDVVDKPAKGEATHRFVLRDGRVLHVLAQEEDDDKTLRRRIVSSEGGFDKWYTSMEWSFALEKGPEGRTESKLTINAQYQLTRPIGVLRQTYRRATGKAEADAKRIFDGIERAAREL